MSSRASTWDRRPRNLTSTRVSEIPARRSGKKTDLRQLTTGIRDSNKVPHSYLTNLKEILGRKGGERLNSSARKFINDRSSIELHTRSRKALIFGEKNTQQTLSNPQHLGPAVSIPKSTRFSTFDRTGPGPGDYNLVENVDKKYV